MIFDGKPAHDINAADIQCLLNDSVCESIYLDYKRDPYPRTPRGTAELLKDVVAFANAEGGYLIIGIADDGTGRPNGINAVTDVESVIRSMLDRCLHGIDERVPGLEVAATDVAGATVVIVHVPESFRKPHCSRPDAEHHFFWRRYQDGNRLMSVAEMRQSLEGDRTLRELTQLRREFARLRSMQDTRAEEQAQVTEGSMFRVKSTDAFLRFAKEQFRETVGDEPCFRLTATPNPVNEVDLRPKRNELVALLNGPPTLRENGFDISPIDGFRQTSMGILCRCEKYNHLRAYWNAHIDYWMSIEEARFHWTESINQQPPYPFLFPYAIIEPTVTFVLLARRVAELGDHSQEMCFTLELHGINGKYLLPFAPEAYGYAMARARAGEPDGPRAYPRDDLDVLPIKSRVTDLPGPVAWELVREVYRRFGHVDAQIPFFDEHHKCTLGDSR